MSSVPTGDVSALVVQSFTPDGKSFVTPSSDGSIRVVDIVPDWPGRKFPVTNSDDFRPQLSPDGTLVAVVHDGSISVIDVMTGEIVAERPADFVFSIYFGPQNRTLAWDDGDFVRLMDLEGGDVRQLPDHGTYGTDVAFSPDGRTVAEIAYHSVRLWDVATGMPAAAQPPELLGDAVGVAYSPDGTLAVSEDQDGTDGITELFAPGQTRRLIRFGGGGLLFSPDGKVLAVDGAGGRVLFSMRDGKPLGGRLPANDLAFGRDGETFATIDYRGSGPASGRCKRVAYRTRATRHDWRSDLARVHEQRAACYRRQRRGDRVGPRPRLAHAQGLHGREPRPHTTRMDTAHRRHPALRPAMRRRARRNIERLNSRQTTISLDSGDPLSCNRRRHQSPMGFVFRLGRTMIMRHLVEDAS